MNLQERRQIWQQHIAASEASNLSGAAFCKLHDLNYGQFNYWRKKFQQTESAETSAGFAQVVPLSEESHHSSEALSVHFPNGIRVSGVNAGNVDVVVALLRQV